MHGGSEKKNPVTASVLMPNCLNRGVHPTTVYLFILNQNHKDWNRSNRLNEIEVS
jgi:hypothetical protein